MSTTDAVEMIYSGRVLGAINVLLEPRTAARHVLIVPQVARVRAAHAS